MAIKCSLSVAHVALAPRMRLYAINTNEAHADASDLLRYVDSNPLIFLKCKSITAWKREAMRYALYLIFHVQKRIDTYPNSTEAS